MGNNEYIIDWQVAWEKGQVIIRHGPDYASTIKVDLVDLVTMDNPIFTIAVVNPPNAFAVIKGDREGRLWSESMEATFPWKESHE